MQVLPEIFDSPILNPHPLLLQQLDFPFRAVHVLTDRTITAHHTMTGDHDKLYLSIRNTDSHKESARATFFQC